MKKLCILMALVVLCTVLFSSCDKITGNDKTKNEGNSVSTTSEPTTLTAEDIAAQEKEAGYAKKCIETLLLSKNADEMKKIIINGDDEYIQDVITDFPENDYTVSVKKLGEYKEYVIYHIVLGRESDADFYYAGIQIFAHAENGLLIELDATIEDEVAEKFHCRNCSGTGIVDYDEIQGVEYKCSTCKGVGFVF